MTLASFLQRRSLSLSSHALSHTSVPNSSYTGSQHARCQCSVLSPHSCVAPRRLKLQSNAASRAGICCAARSSTKGDNLFRADTPQSSSVHRDLQPPHCTPPGCRCGCQTSALHAPPTAGPSQRLLGLGRAAGSLKRRLQDPGALPLQQRPQLVSAAAQPPLHCQRWSCCCGYWGCAAQPGALKEASKTQAPSRFSSATLSSRLDAELTCSHAWGSTCHASLNACSRLRVSADLRTAEGRWPRT